VLFPGRAMAKRATFVIDKQGNIAKIYAAVGNAGGHPEEVLKYVKEHFGEKK
jgi:peroxiredoxin